MYNPDPYMVHKEILKYYIVPSCECLKVLPIPNTFISFWFKHNAEVICKAMNSAWRDGNRVNSFFGEKS